MGRERADVLLVARGLFESRAAARAAIEASRVLADGEPVQRPSQKLAADAVIEAVPAHPFVSRGGVKLAHALDVFGIDSAGRVCLDLGASTGGFTDVLLQREAAHVVCVDVGRGQLHRKIAADPRVSALEGRDARSLEAADLPEAPSLVICDVSFIGLEKLLAVPLGLAAPNAEAAVLFKPQFQVGRAHVGRGGIVRDAAAIGEARQAFAAWASGEGWQVAGETESPITGGDGNREWLLHLVRAT